MHLNPDYLDLLRSLNASDARYLVVGAYAMAFHGVPRYTGDIDIFYERCPANVEKIVTALRCFGLPDSLYTAGDFLDEDHVIQFGRWPRRIDFLSSIDGIKFQDAWKRRESHMTEGVTVPFIDLKALIKNKRASGRSKGSADAEMLEGQAK